MGKWDANIERAKQMLAEAEVKYAQAEAALAGAVPSVRDDVLNFRRNEVEEARRMIEIFTQDND